MRFILLCGSAYVTDSVYTHVRLIDENIFSKRFGICNGCVLHTCAAYTRECFVYKTLNICNGCCLYTYAAYIRENMTINLLHEKQRNKNVHETLWERNFKLHMRTCNQQQINGKRDEFAVCCNYNFSRSHIYKIVHWFINTHLQTAVHTLNVKFTPRKINGK